jgi:hypothetical protein
MTLRKTVSESRKRRSSGTVIVESVFTMLPTLALILAFVDFSLMLFRMSTLQNAVRGGSVPGDVVEVSVQNISFSWLAPLSGSYGMGIPFFRSSTPLSIAVYSSDILGGFPAGVASVTR